VKNTKNAQPIRDSAAMHRCNWLIEYLTLDGYWCTLSYFKTKMLAQNAMKRTRFPPYSIAKQARIVHITTEVAL